MITADNLKADFSLTRAPMVTDNSLLSIFVKAEITNFNPIFNHSNLEQIQFPDFEIGAVSRQDLMVHASVEIVNKAARALAGGVNFTAISLDLFNHQLTGATFSDFVPELRQKEFLTVPVNYIGSVSPDTSFSSSNDTATGHGSFRIQMVDARDGRVMTDFTMTGLKLDGWVKSHPLYSQVYGHVDSNLDDVVVNNEGYLASPQPELLLASSGKVRDMANDFSGFLGRESDRNNRWHKIKGLMFSQLEAKMVPGLFFLGAQFDELFIGKAQNWS